MPSTGDEIDVDHHPEITAQCEGLCLWVLLVAAVVAIGYPIYRAVVWAHAHAHA